MRIDFEKEILAPLMLMALFATQSGYILLIIALHYMLSTPAAESAFEKRNGVRRMG